MRAIRLPIRISRGELILAIGLGCAALPVPAPAQTATPGSDQIQRLQHEIEEMRRHYEAQIRNLQRQLNRLKAGQAAATAAARRAQAAASLSVQRAQAAATISVPPVRPALPPAPPVAAATPPRLARGGFMNAGVKVTLGGYIEGASIFRTRNETADIASSWSGIPLPNSPSYHLSELRFSARQSRLSLLAQAQVNPDTALAAYFETDFLGVGTGVLAARVSTATGSLIIAYDRQRLAPAALWEALCQRGFASGPLPIRESVPVTRSQVDPPSGVTGRSLVELVIGVILDRLLEHSAAALIGALI